MVGDGLLGGLIVLVNARAGTFHNNQAGLCFACHVNNAIEVYVLTWLGAPAAIEPQDVHRTVVVHQFFHLVVDKLLIVFPTLGILLNLVVMAAVWSGFLGPPIVVAMPVGFREIGAGHKAFVAEGVEHIAQRILARIALETAVGDIEIGGLGVPQAETVVMLGGENHIFHAGILCHACPLFGVKLHGVEIVNQAPVPLLVFLVSLVLWRSNPVLRGDCPRFHHAGNRIQAPVQQYAELQVLPTFQFLHHLRVGGPNVVFRLLVHIRLCRSINANCSNDAANHS